ncbi:MAG TPA: glycine cleavage T C-terminal barrel domain-containing protein [Gemmatimonadaceae bacterium]|jgi:folate-binding protein YgfZ|nr:glycine cleavage T C-terminal barrel domain-containing protein [Gemmatimonadaceae bacterium]
MTSPALRPDAAVGEIEGRPVTFRYGSVASEYAALRTSALVVDRSHRTRMTFEGDRRAETLTGLVTNDVVGLGPGAGLYAAALTPRGKIIADIRIFARQNDLLVDVPVRAAAGWAAMVRKYVNPRTTRYVDRTAELSDIAIAGVRAREVVARLVGISPDTLASLSPYAHVSGTFGESVVMVAQVPDVGVEAYELVHEQSAGGALWQQATELGATPGGLDAWEIARVEAGRPEWGLDLDESTIPQEANLDELHAISYTKGCYTGQETVARVHFRGHVNRHLRGIRFGDVGDAQSVPRGAQLFDSADKVVGDVRTSVMSPRLGGIAIGMVRREVVPGASVRARWDGGEAVVGVVALPFPA